MLSYEVNEGGGGEEETYTRCVYLIGNNQNPVLVVLSKKDACLLGVVLVYRDKKKKKIGVWLTASTLPEKKMIHLIDHRERHGSVRIRADRQGLDLFLLRLLAVRLLLRFPAEFFLRRGPVLKKEKKTLCDTS